MKQMQTRCLHLEQNIQWSVNWCLLCNVHKCYWSTYRRDTAYEILH